MMASLTQVERGTQVVTEQPRETVLTAFPYRPHITLLDFLKGEPRVLATVQILLALIIAGIGAIFAFNYIKFFHLFPLVFVVGYPFWGAFVFILTGYITRRKKKSQTCLGQCVLPMNIISSLVALAGITITIISYKDQHENCQKPSLAGICVVGRTLLIGILSVLLIISIVEFSISVTIVSFRSKCWTKANEIVFFLPSDVTQNNELCAPEASVQLQFELQEESSNDDTRTHIHTAFFGGYAFFKLRVSGCSLVSQPTQQLQRRSKEGYRTTSISLPDEHLEFSQEEVELKSLPPTSEKKPSESTMNTQQGNSIKQLEDEGLQSAIGQPSKMQTQLPQAQDLPLQVFPSHSAESHVQKAQELLSQDMSSDVLPNQVLQSQALQFEDSKSHSTGSQVSKTHILTSQDGSSQGHPSQDLPLQDMSAQNMLSQEMTTQDMSDVLSEGSIHHTTQSFSLQESVQQSSDRQSQDTLLQEQKFKDLSFQDIQSEVMSLTQEWKFEEDLRARKSPKRLSLVLQMKGWQSSKHKSLDEQSQGQSSPKRKSLDRQSKDWQSPKKQYPDWEAIDKQVQDKQHSDQQAEDQEKQSTKQLPQSGQDEGQQAEKKSPKKATQDQQSEDQQAQEEQSPLEQSQDWQSKAEKAQEMKTLRQQSPDWKTQLQQYQAWQYQDWRAQGWRDKDGKPQEWQFEVQHPLQWESHTWQAQNLLEKEALIQKALYQEAQTQHAIALRNLDWQGQDIPFQDSQYQNEHQDDLKPIVTQKEDMQEEGMQTTDVKPRDLESRDQKPMDLQSEDIKLNFPSTSCQSSLQDTYFNSLSEQDLQQNLSTCSSSNKEDLNLSTTSYCPKDGQQSKD
ncbi:membrane-spanning 4-domains subfamily A member 14 isoform X1 [Tamandua tetradactyla]|uniref:membrane-spanning 4-domains subfamily A member 14 isoform X1 n=2 Tax=Tamandua tetradactyla TaxID=48850 RepID=UPI004053AD2C